MDRLSPIHFYSRAYSDACTYSNEVKLYFPIFIFNGPTKHLVRITLQ